MLSLDVLGETLGRTDLEVVEVLCCEGQLVLGRVHDPHRRWRPGMALGVLGLDASVLEELGPDGLELDGGWWAPVAHGPWLLGLVRLERPADRSLRRRLALLAERFVDEVPVPDGGAHVIWVQHPDGSWFGAEGVPPTEVVALADHLRGGAAEHTSAHAGRRHVVLRALRGPMGEHSVLVQTWPTSRLRCPPLVQLTPMQATVVSYTVAGATLGETARTLERSRETVRQHLRGAYDRLGVACRAELVSACRWRAA